MDIQSVIISFNELNNTKNAIANAIRAKGISSSGRFANFASEINSIQAGIGGSDYKKLMDNLSQYNVFRKGDDNRLSAIGTVKEKHEVVIDNSVTIYSLYNIENVRISDGQYKNRVKQIASNKSYQLTADGQNCGNVSYFTLALSVTPQEADNPNGSVNITYTTNGQDYTVTMPIKDMPMIQPNNTYVMIQTSLDEHVNDTKFRQRVNVEDYMPSLTHLKGVNVEIGVHQSRPEIFNTLNNLGVYSSINAMLILPKDNGDFEYIPVKLIKSLASQTIPLLEGYNAAVLELEDDKLVFHYSDTAGRLNPQCIVSTKDGVYNTDTTILDKIKQNKQGPNDIIGIVIHHDGSLITEEEVKQMGIF